MSIANKLAEERRGRLAAERMLELKQAQLFAANRKLDQHARALSEEINETRAEVATVRDENLRVKSDLSAAHQKIELVERRLWQSIETINDGFAFYNADSEMIIANRAYLAVFDGLEMIKPGVNYVTVLQMLTDEGIVDMGDQAPADWRQHMIERLQQSHPEPITIRLWNGEWVKIFDRRGPEGDIISLGINITATMEYEQNLRDARAAAEAANRAKSAFLANMSHEIRTPMNGVVGMADVLKETDLSEEQQLYVETIKSSGEALLVIINDVLDYSKIEADRLELHVEPFDLERVVHDVMRLLKPSAREKGLALALDFDLLLPSDLMGDPGRLRQVLTNLIGNAIKFTAAGHVLIRVCGSATTEAVTFELVVEDTGIGIPSNMLGHIFGEFNQVENERNRQFDGTGLGLAITQRLVGMMGGRIGVTSEEGAGSQFSLSLTLPRGSGAAPDLPALPKGLCHVLLVDDCTVRSDALARQLGQMGLQVTACTAANLPDPPTSFDAILIDHDAAGGSGLDLAQATLNRGFEGPVLLLIANPGFAEKHPVRPALAGVLQKPLSRQDLLGGIAALMPPDTAPRSVFRHRRPDAAPKPIPKRRPMRVLAAEDNKTNQLVFRKMIKDLAVELVFAANGKEAVELYREFAPDIVFMDISMPVMDGKDATRAIRAIERSAGTRVPIVALTAHAMAEDGIAILEAGLDHHLTKPLRKAEIVACITDHCPEDAAAPSAAWRDQVSG